jgi:hypothetical protein
MTVALDLEPFRLMREQLTAAATTLRASIPDTEHLARWAAAVASIPDTEHLARWAAAARAESRRCHHRRRALAAQLLTGRRAHAEAVAAQLDRLDIEADIDTDIEAVSIRRHREPSSRPPRCPYLDRPRSHAPPRYVEHNLTNGVAPP